jgi:hypothetical protein
VTGFLAFWGVGLADADQHDSGRHSDAGAARLVRLSLSQQAELIRQAEHWLSSPWQGPGQARLVLDIGQKGLTIRGGAGIA